MTSIARFNLVKFEHKYLSYGGKWAKDHKAIEYNEFDAKYRLYVPTPLTIIPTAHGGFRVNYRMDHDRHPSWSNPGGGDEHAEIVINFERHGYIVYPFVVKFPDTGSDFKLPVSIKGGKGGAEIDAKIDVAAAVRGLQGHSAGSQHFRETVANSVYWANHCTHKN